MLYIEKRDRVSIRRRCRTIKANVKERKKEALKRDGRRRQDDMYVRDFSSMYSDECSKSAVRDIQYSMYIRA